MKVLIIEDDPIKLLAIKDYIQSVSKNIYVDEKMSYQSGLFSLIKNNYDLVLLDMQLPNYDIKSGEDGYKLRPIAGRYILKEIKRKKIKSSVIIITQYEGFGENGKFASLGDWDKVLKTEFSNIYKCTIRYKPGSDSWKNQLSLYLKQSFDD